MKNLKSIYIAVIVLTVLSSYGCTDLNVDNMNAPDTESALANPGDIESLVGNQYLQWWSGTQQLQVTGRLSALGNESINGYSFMSDFTRLPRIPFNNSPTYNFNNVVTQTWSNLYTAISSANDGLVATDDRGVELSTESDTQRLRAFAKFIQGISYMVLGNHFNQAFLIDENVDLESAELEFEDYDAVFAYGLDKLGEARQIAQQYDFTLPSSWIRGNALSSAEFIELMNSYEARYRLQQPRTVEDRNALNFSEIQTLIENGVEGDFIIDSNNSNWGHTVAQMQNENWRIYYTHIGFTDESGAFETWKNQDPNERDPIRVVTSDKRIAGQEDVIADDGTVLEAKSRAPGTDFAWKGPVPWSESIGAWYSSEYFYHRSNHLWLNSYVGDVYHMREAEMDLYLAEILLRNSEPDVDSEAVELINKTRVDRGGLEPVTVSDDFDDVWNAMRYEFDIETTYTASGLPYYHKRGLGHYRGKDYGGLIEGTPLHFPVPGEELELLELPIYTFGGDGEWAAP